MSSWIAAARKVLDTLEQTQAENVEAAAGIVADSIAAGGVAYAFGTGHSRMPVEELFPRYGSFPGFHPLVELSMTFHTEVVGCNGQRQAMFIEQVEGLAEQILANFDLHPPDSMLVFSASGLNAVPIEIAMGARQAGLRVIAVTALAESLGGKPRHSSDTRLCDHADVVIDLCTPVGDALCEVEGLEVPVGPGSTLAAVTVVNWLKVRVAELLTARGAMPPVLTSSRLVGPDRSGELFDAAYSDHARRAAAVLRRS